MLCHDGDGHSVDVVIDQLAQSRVLEEGSSGGGVEYGEAGQGSGNAEILGHLSKDGDGGCCVVVDGKPRIADAGPNAVEVDKLFEATGEPLFIGGGEERDFVDLLEVHSDGIIRRFD